MSDTVQLEGGRFRMGSDRHYPEEAPSRMVAVGPFAIDRTPVTNAAFAAFVAQTGWVTLAERRPDPAAYPGADPAALVPGSAVFDPAHPSGRWWHHRPGAHWRVPHADGAPADPSHPVVHVALEDAEAFAAFVGAALPTEAEWEFAARGGLDGAPYAWGDAFMPGGVALANTWHGRFPRERLDTGGWTRTSPVSAFPPNGFGLHDMIGNVWEWTATRWTRARDTASCCAAASPGPAAFVIKGGSHLCAPNYCQRYRPAARQPQAADSPTSHLGFRCVRRR